MGAMLFNSRLIAKALEKVPAIPEQHQNIVAQWAGSIRDSSIFSQNETNVEGDFKNRILETVLGYVPFGTASPQTIKAKHKMGSGEVDIALGSFDGQNGDVLAPFELKGASTRDLDAPMPGRKISPDYIVYRLFDLEADEVSALEASLVTAP